MKIAELVSGKNAGSKIEIEGVSVAVSSLKGLMEQGYEYMKPYRDEKTFSIWGKICTACVPFEQLAKEP